ncbi:MAG: tol-pal system-associated acyl-CoA thioesterase [Aquificaceae bacterium]|nr:MAG: tol-pal system-associated acyl-CoA thioesterase [Aquificaceae bacterium]
MTNKASNKNDTPYALPIRIYYEDTDAGGVVYHSNYLNFFERARTEWLRDLGYEQDVLREEENIVFVVRSVSIDYLKPALFNDEVMATAEIKKIGRSSMEISQKIVRKKNADMEVLASATVVIVCVNTTRFKPVKIPEAIRRAMEVTTNC